MTPNTLPLVCAAPGCEEPVPRTHRQGRPAIYCSPEHRPSAATNPPRRRTSTVVVEVAHPETSPDGRPADRVWTVRLRRGTITVIIADNLGWPTANALHQQLANLLGPTPQHTGAAID